MALVLCGVCGERPAVIQSVVGWASWSGAVVAPRMLASSSVGRAQLWDTQTHHALRTFENLRDAVLSPDARLVAGNSANSASVEVIDSGDGSVVSRIEIAGGGQQVLAISPDDARVVIDRSASDGGLVVADTRTGAILYTLAVAGGGAAFSSDGRMLATLEPKRRAVLLWEARTGAFLRRFNGEAGALGPPLFSPDDRFLVVVANAPRTPPHGDGSFHIDADAQLQLEVRDLSSGAIVRRIPFWSEPGYSYFESPGYFAFADAHRLVSSSRTDRTLVTDLGAGRVTALAAHGFVVRSGDETAIVDGLSWLRLEGDALAPVWRFAATSDITDLTLSGADLAIAEEDRVMVWDLAHAALRCSIRLDGGIRRLAYRAPLVLELETERGPRRVDPTRCSTMPAQIGARAAAAFVSPDKTRILEAAPFKLRTPARLDLRNARTNEPIATLSGLLPPDTFDSPFASRASIAVLQTDHSPFELVVVDASNGETRMTLPTDAGARALSPDGTALAVASQTRTTVYDTSDGHRRFTFPAGASRLLFAGNGAALVAIDDDAGLRVSSLAGETIATLSLIARPGEEPAWVISVPGGAYASSPDGVTFVEGGRADAAAVAAALGAALK